MVPNLEWIHAHGVGGEDPGVKAMRPVQRFQTLLQLSNSEENFAERTMQKVHVFGAGRHDLKDSA